jgi:integrase/recombinase XerD
MDTITSGVTPLRQRMLEDMRMRKLERRTQETYIRAVLRRVRRARSYQD